MGTGGANAVTDERKGVWRLLELAQQEMRKIVSATSLSLRFLVVAFAVVAAGMVVLGQGVDTYLRQSVATGVATSAASSIDALVSHEVAALGALRPLTAETRAKLDEIFAIGNDAETGRLLTIRIRDLDGTLLYETQEGLVTELQPAEFAAAARGEVSYSIQDVPLAATGSIAAYPVTVLKIYTPLHRPDDGEIFAVAALYHSASAIVDIQERTRLAIWLLVGSVGVLVIGLLYFVVNQASNTILRQRSELAHSLTATRQLLQENSVLRDASDRLRINAAIANERLLAQVGSDIHDGPLQLLTAIILRLSGPGRSEPGRAEAVQLATEAMEDLRNISSGLALPELADRPLGDVLELAVSRHRAITGANVHATIGPLATDVSMAVKTCAYRVVQEALNNAVRHGNPSQQRVDARMKGRALVITVSNDAASDSTTGPDDARERLGLRGMRSRVEALGGTLDVTIGRRTLVHAHIPTDTEPAALV
jgi:signal transduction histidine kinase